jgi:hypothetical protein
VAFGLTARHLVLASPAAALMLAGVAGLATGAVPAWLVAPAEIVLAAGALAAVATNPDGETLDAYLRAAIAHRRSPRREARLPAGRPCLPAWAAEPEARQAAPLALPWDGIDPRGFLRLGTDDRDRELGVAGVLRLSPVDLDLLSDEELDALVAGCGSLLNSIETPVQFVVRAEPADLGGALDELEERWPEEGSSPARSGPAVRLGELARSRAALLRSLADGGLQHRVVYVAYRHQDPERLAGVAARLAEGFRRLGVRADRLQASDLGGMLGGGAVPGGCVPGKPVRGRA